jgi:hypothetical protein
MTAIPTRWRNTIRDQLGNALERTASAVRHLDVGNGSRALQEAYPAIVASATIRVWLSAPPWSSVMRPEEMHRRVRQEFPSLFAALAELDVQQALTSPWRAKDVRPYIEEAQRFVAETAQKVDEWLGQA